MAQNQKLVKVLLAQMLTPYYTRSVQPVARELKFCGPRKGLDFKWSVVRGSKS